jgi:hypothetical protein
MSDPTGGELGPAITPAAAPAPAAPSSAPAARVGQAERDTQGQSRWNSPRDHAEERAQWDQSQRDRHSNNPEARQAKPGQATKPADGAPEGSVRIGDTTLSESEVRDYLAHKAARESGRLQSPQKPEEYQIALSPDFTPPLGAEVVLDANDPAFGPLKDWACRNQISQDELSRLVDIYGAKVSGDLARGRAAHDAEIAKLGATGPQRVDALARWLVGMIGDQGLVLAGTKDKTGRSTNGIMWTAGIVGALEALQRRVVSQGASGYTGNGRDMGGQDAGKIAGYDKMSFAERRHAQDQLAARRGGS